MTHLKFTFAAAMLCFATAAQAAEGAAPDAPFGNPAISENRMSEMRGGAESVQVGSQNGDCINCNITASSSVAGNAFQNAAGLITVIQNTGANVVLQSSTVVNVNVR